MSWDPFHATGVDAWGGRGFDAGEEELEGAPRDGSAVAGGSGRALGGTHFVPARAHAGWRVTFAPPPPRIPRRAPSGGPATSHERARDDAPSAADDPAPESASSARSSSSRANRHRGRDHHHHHHHRHPPPPRVDDDRSPPLPRRVANVLANVLGRLRAAPTVRLTREVAARARPDARERGEATTRRLAEAASGEDYDATGRRPRGEIRFVALPGVAFGYRGVLLPTDENETVTDFSFSPLSPPPLGFLSYDVEAGLDPDGASRVAVAAVAETRAIVLPLKKTLARGHGRRGTHRGGLARGERGPDDGGVEGGAGGGSRRSEAEEEEEGGRRR